MANVETALLHSAKGPKRSALQGSGRYPLTPAGQTAEEPDAGQGGFLYGLLRYVRSVYAVNGTDGKILTSPEKNDVQIVIPYAPGGGSDNLVRGMMQYLDLGATTVAVNVEGAAGYIGALQGYNSKNDGYTIMTHNEMDLISYTMSGQSAEPLYENLEYICDVVTDYNLLSTSPDTGWKTAQDVIDYVNANPGKVTVGSTGSNNVNYGTTMELLKDMGIYDKVTIVPYDGGAASETALQGGHIQLEVNSLADTSGLRTKSWTSARRETDVLL